MMAAGVIADGVTAGGVTADGPMGGGDTDPIGPGRLVAVVGPSGAGKDTLIAEARARLAGDPAYVFPLRVVTRAASAAEDHLTISDADFAPAVSRGDFAFWWEAHGLKYALPAVIDADIRSGRTVVCNVSRGIVAALRLRYARLVVVLVTAPADILAGRLAGRGRRSDGDLGQRLGRGAPPPAEFAPDRVIENIGDVADGASRLIAAIIGAQETSVPSRVDRIDLTRSRL
jgi:ribose 1,5-bisphosphokinase